MGKESESMITDLPSERRLSMISEWKELATEERIDKAMHELGITSEWRRAVAKGANYIAPCRFAALVEETKTRAKSSKPRYFIKCIGRELRAR